MDQRSPDFFIKRRRNCSSLYVFPILDILPRSGDIRDQSLKWSKFTEISHVFGSQFFFFGGGALELFELHYKIQLGFDHAAKFQSDRSKDLGEKKKLELRGRDRREAARRRK